MDDIDFYALAATDRTVLGISAGSTPDQVEDMFGADFIDDRQREILRRDYGLLEIVFYRDSSWECRAISIQIHRLLWGKGDIVPAVLRNKFGKFSPRIKIGSLVEAISKRGFHVTPAPNSGSPDFFQMVVQESGVELIVAGDASVGGSGHPEPGDVWSILLPHGSSPRRP